jgi:DNA-binding NtrC family response regulator
MDRPLVLVVEDRPNVLELMATILEDAYDVTLAPDGAAALSVIGSKAFDVVLTDIRMPGASGFEVLRAVQARSPRTRVVMMTAYANVPDAVAAMKQGAFDYVAKPLDADEIALVVARAVEHLHGDAVSEEDHDAAGAGADPHAASGREDLAVGYHCAVERARDRASRRYLVELMRLFQGNVTQAARRAGMTRESLHRVLRKYGVRAEHRGERPDGAAACHPDDGVASTG